MAFWKLSLLEWLTGTIAVGGLTVGAYSFINPRAAARIYGIPTYDATNESTLALILGTRIPYASKSTAHESDAQSKTRSEWKTDNEILALIHSLGVRNFTAGLTILVLTVYWRSLTAKGDTLSLLMAIAVLRALGLVILIGALVPVVDAWVCVQHSRAAEVQQTAAWR